MNKSNPFNLLILGVISFFITMSSCNDYDDEISNLRIEITELRQKIDDINSSIKEGNSIKSVAPTTNGIIITLTNNESYTITNGENGSAGSIVNIGSNGNWFIDGVDTGNPSRGTDGVVGGYYYPHEDGFWYKVEGGVEEKTDQNWMISGGNLTAVYANGSVTLYNVEGIEEPVTLGQAILSYLTLIPDFVTKNNIPVINFSSLTTECTEIAPVTRIRYRVSPKNASVESIDIENIYFEYNNPTIVATKSTEINPKATFISLEDGIITIEIEINADAIEKENSGKIDQVMLMVPLKNGDEVNSDWGTVVSSAMDSEDLALVRAPKEDEEAPWSSMKFTGTLAETKAIDKTDARVAEIQFGRSIDLATVVEAMIAQGDWSFFNIDTYNLEIAFDLNDENGNAIDNKSAANVDQQQYISLDGSVVTSLVYDVDGATPPLVDRNPIVHVVLKSKDGSFDCNVAEGFIKLNMIEDQLIAVDPVSFTAEEVITVGCEEFTFRINPSQMESEFYSKSEMDMDSFHSIYTWTQKGEGIGTIEQVQDPEDAESFNLLWTVSIDDLWDNQGSSITKSGAYTFGSNTIDVAFTATVATETTIDLSGLLIADKWFNDFSNIKHNVSTPELNLNSAFKSTEAKLLDLGSVNTSYSGYSYEYLFDAAQPLTTVDGITITISTDSKQLLTNGEVMLTILPQENGRGDIIKFNPDNQFANTLLNKEEEFLKAKIKLTIKNECDRPVPTSAFKDGDTFLIHFFISEDSGTVYVVPNGTGSGSSWSDAMGDIQAAINKATEGNGVWVRGGTYLVSAPIALKDGIDVYGSFSGNEENIESRPTLIGADPWDFINPTVLDGQEQYRIMNGSSSITSKTTVDGITFTRGYHETRAGAIENTSALVVFQNCIVRENKAPSNGGAIFMRAGTIQHSLIENNHATSGNGGGLFATTYAGEEIIIDGCSFRENTATRSGGLQIQGEGMTSLLNSKIYNNTAFTSGGGLQNTSNTLLMYNCLVFNNDGGNGGAMNHSGGKVFNCSFVNNTGNIYFGNTSGNYEFVNNIIHGNLTASGANTSVSGGALNNADMIFQNNAVGLTQENMDNRPGTFEDNIPISAGSNAPHFVGSSTFVGTPENDDQKQELEYIDLNILQTSPCYNTGKTIPQVTRDIMGTPRPQGGAYDMGAYELVQ